MTFRLKLLLATMLVVGGVTSAALVATQQNVGANYTRIFHERFEDQVRLLDALQEARLASVKTRLRALARSPRLLAVLEAEVGASPADAGHVAAPVPDTARVYQTVKDVLLGVLAAERTAVFRVVDADGRIVPPDFAAGDTAVSGERGPWEEDVARVARGLTAADPQRVGYLALGPQGAADAPDGSVLHEFVITKVIDGVTGRDRGALVIGFPVEEFGEATGVGPTETWSGIWHAGRLYSRSIPLAERRPLAEAVADVTAPQPLAKAVAQAAAQQPAAERVAQVARPASGERDDPATTGDTFTFDVGGAAHVVFHQALYPEAGFPPSYSVVLYSLAELEHQQRALRRRILAFGGLGLLVALALSLVLAHRLSVPIRELAAASGAIGAGNLTARVPVRGSDETGRLAVAFNAMAEGLALKERYRSVLDLVADKSVARRLVEGELALGGELREVTVLFCDIRGFTGFTEEMTPAATVALLNEHMAALTRVVHTHGGVIDKFVGDGLMAIFGAPQRQDDHALAAVHTAWEMLAERARLNQSSGRELAIGVGIASGPVVAGCIGAADRLNYTVVGGDVNLAARLCDQAGRMEILIAETTRGELPPSVGVGAVPPLVLKGFSAPVAAYRVTGVAALATAS